MRRHCKIIISVVTMALIFTLVFSPASYAIDRQRISAFIASALAAGNIVMTSTASLISDASRDVMDFISYPVKVVANQFVDVPYTTPLDTIDDYLDRSSLIIRPNNTIIDGVPYSDVWISREAAEIFRVNALDIATAWNIASESTGTFATAVGRIEGLPVFELTPSNQRTQQTSIPADVGTYGFGTSTITVSPIVASQRLDLSVKTSTMSTPSGNNYYPSNFPVKVYYKFTSNIGTQTAAVLTRNDGNTAQLTVSSNAVRENFAFDWVAGEIPPEFYSTLPNDYGINYRIPTSEIQTVINNYPEYIDNSVNIDLDIPDMTDFLDDLIDVIIPLIPVIDIDYQPAPAPVPDPDPDPEPEPQPIPEPIPAPIPYPDPDPQPGTTISNTDWKDIFDVLKNIYNRLADQISISQSIKNILDKIKWFTDSYFDKLGDLPDLFERHVIDTIRRGIDAIKTFFAPLFASIASAINIWHYVVEWWQEMTLPFGWYYNIMEYGYPLYFVPVYACIAGFIVIAVYKRFGR